MLLLYFLRLCPLKQNKELAILTCLRSVIVVFLLPPAQLARSAQALVNISLRVDIAATHEQIQIVKSALEQTIRDHPRIWSTLVNFRITKVDPANDLIVYSARVQHVKSWQDLLPVLQARGDLEQFLQEILVKLGIQFWAEVNTQAVYLRELPENQPLLPGDDANPNLETMLARSRQVVSRDEQRV